jgi:hypothetical protein
MNWKPPKQQRPRDQWGQFRSKAEVAAELQAGQAAARHESMLVAREELYWQEQDRLDWEREEADQ